MNQEASQKTHTFMTQIRTKQRNHMMEKERQRLNEQQQQQRKIRQILESDHQNYEEAKKHIFEQFNSKNIKSIFALQRSHQNYIDYLTQSMIEEVLPLFFNSDSLCCREGLGIVCHFVKYASILDQRVQFRKEVIKRILSNAGFEQNIFIILGKNIEQKRIQMAQTCIECISHLSLLRMEKIRQKSLLEKYLLVIVQNCISTDGTLTFLTYISEVHIFSPFLISLICEQITSNKLKTPMSKYFVNVILHNYILMQKNQQNVVNLFDCIVNVCSIIYRSCINNQRMAFYGLENISQLIDKFPQSRGLQLLSKKSFMGKFQQTALTALIVDGDAIKNKFYEIYQTVIDKTIDSLKEKFFDNFHLNIIHSFVEGAQHTSSTIIFRCLKVLIKLLTYAPKKIMVEIEQQNQFKFVLENLAFHDDPKISSLAETCISVLNKQSMIEQ